ncbi:trypsin-like serine protease [Mesorhizobium sp. M2A.F.Ca.ET.042.01.1.1]|uniref:trypsin-like serine protease n=1 Tax=Mesorhizobium sp. M2A.F.Ca.ET.042.01.1.1 TaxID=2496745 RepID=UPI0016798F62|nr:trypsin-like serine protease [Mesorhizobium sp. M2A.F.Ca.ET.042.01.1.1]
MSSVRAIGLAFALAVMSGPARAGDLILHDYLAVQKGQAEDAAPLNPEQGGASVKVAGGDQADWATEFNSLVRINYRTPRGPSQCSGVMIGDQTVLTAGHCSCGSDFVFTLSSGLADKPTEEYKLNGYVRRYPGFSCQAPLDTQNSRDLALMWLNDRVPGRAPRIVHMLDLKQSNDVSKLAVVGFGRDENGVVQDEPRIGQVPIFSFFCSSGMAAGSICRPFREFALAVTPGGGEKKVDTCEGDSGGPVFAFRRKTSQEVDGEARVVLEDILVGITSRAMAGTRNIPGLNCGGGGIYTAVGNSDIVNWLLREGVPAKLVTQTDLLEESQPQ